MRRLAACLLVWHVMCPSAAADPAAGQAPAGVPTARAVNVSSGAEFWAAAGDASVGVVQLVQDIQLADSSGQSLGPWTPYRPLLRTSNLTITTFCGDGGACSNADLKMLDFGYLSDLLLMDQNVSVHFVDIAISNYRKDTRLGVPLVIGRAGSAVHFYGTIGYRAVCSPSVFQQQALQAALPSQQQQHSPALQIVDSFCWRGACYNNSMKYVDYTTVVPASGLDSSVSAYGADSGYFFEITNAMRLCGSYWPVTCMTVKLMTADQCNEYYTDATASQQKSHVGVNLALVVPLAVLGAVLVLGSTLTSIFVQRWRLKHQQQSPKPPSDACEVDIEAGHHHNSAGSVKPSVDLFGVVSIADMHTSKWQMLDCHGAPHPKGAELAENKIQFGILLGCGSAGRVYRAFWCDKDVAVKVLPHDVRMSTQVANEVNLMMQFDHPNVVKAHHVISWQHSMGDNNQGLTHRKTGTCLASAGSHNYASSMSLVDIADSTMWQGGMVIDSNTCSGNGVSGHCAFSRGSHAVHKGAVQASSSNSALLRAMSRLQDLGGGVVSRSTSSALIDHSQANVNGSNMGIAQTWLIQEFCNGGSLADSLRAGREQDSDGKPAMVKVLTRLRDVASGMQYLHARNVLHRDLKSANVLLMLDRNAPCGSVAKVADFSLSCAMHPGQTHHSTRTMGTVSHMAPELLRAGKQSPAADVYAFGIVMWELVVGRAPFSDVHYGEVFERVAINGERPRLQADLQALLGEGYVVLMHACWAADPTLRPTFDQVCSALGKLLARHAGGNAPVMCNATAKWLGLTPLAAPAPMHDGCAQTLGRGFGATQDEPGPIDGFF